MTASDSITARRLVGFWVVALAFTTAMAFTTVPTPLWSLYAQRDRFSSLTVSIVFAAYALAVALSLFLAGHLSDAYGRRRVLMPALALQILALAQWTGRALLVPFAVFAAALLLVWAALLLAPETRDRPSPRPRYRPQRVSMPARSRGRFFAAAVGAAISFAVFGLLTSLAPSFLAGTLHQPSHLLAGAVSFAAFATAALAQTLTGSRTTHWLLAAAIPALLAGLGLLTIAVWLPSPSFGVFVAGDVVVGLGSGLMFKGAIASVVEISAPEHRAETLAGIYLAAYLGLAGPVIGLGALTQIASTRVSLLVFAALLALAILPATPAMLGRHHTHRLSQPQPTSS